MHLLAKQLQIDTMMKKPIISWIKYKWLPVMGQVMDKALEAAESL